MKKLKPWVKKTLAIGVTTMVIGFGTIKILPEAIDNMFYTQYELPTMEAKQMQEEINNKELDEILKDNTIDQQEMERYNELTGQASK